MTPEQYRAKLAEEGRPYAKMCGHCRAVCQRQDLAPAPMERFKGNRACLLCQQCRDGFTVRFNHLAHRIRGRSLLETPERS
jgi:MinD superfamily P-loop ATPase